MFRNTFVILVSVLLAVGCRPADGAPGADGIGDTFYPQLGNGGYNALHYTLELSIDPRNNTLSGTCIMEAQATQPLRAFNMDFSGLTVERVLVNGRDAEYLRNGRELTIIPARSINTGDNLTAIVTYSGTPHVSPSFGALWSSGWHHTNENEVFVSSAISGAANWYPVNDHPLDKASYSFRITVPKPYVVAANGLLQQQIDHGNTVTFIWESAEPIASYEVAVNIAEYVIESEQGPDGVVIRHYLPADFPETSKAGVDQVAEMLDFFVERFGPYPFPAYGIVIVDFPEDGPAAMETQMLSQHDADEISREESSISEYIIAHELAHQWFGDSVSVKYWRDIWLKEGAATYAGWLWLEHQQRGTLEAKVQGIYPIEAFSPNPPGNPSPSNLYTNTISNRGALTFHALRLQVGDGTFFQILRTYLERYRFGNASTADFITVAEEVSKQGLNEFFEGWLYDTKIPDIPGLDPD